MLLKPVAIEKVGVNPKTPPIASEWNCSGAISLYAYSKVGGGLAASIERSSEPSVVIIIAWEKPPPVYYLAVAVLFVEL